MLLSGLSRFCAELKLLSYEKNQHITRMSFTTKTKVTSIWMKWNPVSTDLDNWLTNLTISKETLNMPTLHSTSCSIPSCPACSWSLVTTSLHRKPNHRWMCAHGCVCVWERERERESIIPEKKKKKLLLVLIKLSCISYVTDLKNQDCISAIWVPHNHSLL